MIAYSLARPPGRALVIRTEESRTRYLQPSKLAGWADYHQLFPDFSWAAQMTALEFAAAHPDAAQAVKLLATESASMVMTLFRALEDVLPDLPTRSKLCIHIVAADSKELTSRGIMEELLHYLPQLKTLTLAYVGPAVYGTDPPNLACSDCQRTGRRRVAIRHAATYHEFARSPEYAANPPDLVAGFNTGMGEIDVAGWRNSLGVVLDSATPAVFTAYTAMEAKVDSAMLRGLGARFVKYPQKNTWSAPSTTIQERYRQPGAEHRSNNYRFIIQGRTSSDVLE